MPADLPNVLVILTDQHSAHMLSCAGTDHVSTPHLDRLAGEGVRFERAYVTFPLCVPSRISMMTGRYPHELGVHSNDPDVEPTAVRSPQSLAAIMSRRDYRCAYAGKWHATRPSAEPADGFEVIKNFGDERLVDSVAGYLRRTIDDPRPFFVVASFDDPHTICEVARNQPSYYGSLPTAADRKTPNLPANFGHQPFEPEALRAEQRASEFMYGTASYSPDDWRRYRRAYADLVERADQRVGDLLAVLDELGLDGDTMVVFTSDHGDGDAAHAWNQKTALFEEIIRVPLLARWPGQTPLGAVDDASLVSVGLDLLPTLCQVSGAPTPSMARGASLLPAMTRGEPLDRSLVVTETGFGSGPQPRTSGRAVVEPRYKYLIYSWGRHREQLYDLQEDPAEVVNLAVETRYGDILARFRQTLLNWCLQTDDTSMLKRLILPEDVSAKVGAQIYAVPY